MTRLTLHPVAPIYVAAEAAPLADGWQKRLAFIPHQPPQYPEVELADVLGQGAIVVVSVAADEDWLTGHWIRAIASDGNCHLAYVVRGRNGNDAVLGRLNCDAEPGGWVARQRAELECAFSHHRIAIAAGTRVTYDQAAPAMMVEGGASTPRLEGFDLHGASDPELHSLRLDMTWPGGLCFTAQSEVVASDYGGEGTSTGARVLGQNFTRLRQTFLGTFNAERIGYPLLALPDPSTTLRLDFVLDPAEPQVVDPLPTATRTSRVKVLKVEVGGRQLDTLPLNFFAATGARLSARASDLTSGLDFHFVPQLDTFGSGAFAYSGAALAAHGSLKAASGSALLGVGQLERVEAFESIGFDAFSPAAALDAELRDGANGSVGRVESALTLPAEHFLSGRAVASAVSFERPDAAAPRVLFSPDAMPLYTRAGPVVPNPYEPLPCQVPPAMPVATADLDRASGDALGAAAFERTVIAPHRMQMLGDAMLREAELAALRPGARATNSETIATTPQGFKIVKDAGGWKEIEFAAGPGWRLVLDLGTDPGVRMAIQALFSRKEIFVVIRDMPPVNGGQPPTLRLEYSASGWSFRTYIASAAAESDTEPGVEPPIVIVKFGGRSALELFNDTESWLGRGLFFRHGSAAEVEATKQRLLRCKDTLQVDLATDKNSRKPFSAPFIGDGSNGQPLGKLRDAEWNGLGVFSLSMEGDTSGSSPFPQDLQPLLDGYRALLSATVLCADLRPATSDATSEVLGLVRFETGPGDRPPDSTDEDCAGGFNLKKLRVLLRSGGVDNFECELGFKLSRFLGQPLGGLNNDATLLGTYDRRTDTTPPSDAYSFALLGNYQREFTNSPVERVSLSKIGYERTGDKSGQLLLRGEVDLALDELGARGISFDRLGLGFDAALRKFSFAPGLISMGFDPNKFSKLLRSLPFKLRSFSFGRLPLGRLASFEQLGFQRLPLGGMQISTEFAYGLTFDLDLGSLGAIARKLEAFGAQLFVGWRPGSKLPTLGIKLNGNGGGPFEISAFDVITLSADRFAAGKLDPAVSGGQDVYFLSLQNLRVKLLNLRFPDDDAQQHLYFFYPPANPGGVGFVYGRVAPDQNFDLLGIGKHATVDGLLGAQTVQEGMALVRRALPNVGENNLPMKPGTGIKYDPGTEWFLALSAQVFDLAKLELLMSDPRVYGARITLPLSEWGLGRDWFIDALYRRLDEKTGIFSLEVPPPIPVLDFGAVQVILPTIRGEFGTPGNHLLVDFGFPEKKSLATWARTGKIVAGIFGGEGGAYFGRIAPSAFSVRFTPAYDANYEFGGGIFTAGIAASFGLMRYFAAGPMTGHASLTGFFTVEGAYATIRRKESGQELNPAPPSQFFALAGAFGIKGSVEACVDFGLIKVAVGFNMTIMFSLPYKTWHAIAMTASVNVNAYARVVIARIKIPFDGRLEISVSFSFSFETSVSLQISGADSRLPVVFQTAPQFASAPLALLRQDARSLASSVNASWTWPTPTLAVLGLGARLSFPAWFMAARSVDDRAAPSPGDQDAVLMPFFAIGENPQYHSDEDSVSALVEAFGRWMLTQVADAAHFDPNARLDFPTLLAAHMSLQPDGQDGTPAVETVDGGAGNSYEQSISREASLTALRPAFAKLDFARLTELYALGLEARARVPGSKPGQSRDAKVIPFPLAPAFELFITAQAPLARQAWNGTAAPGVDLSTYRPLSGETVRSIRDTLNDYYATLNTQAGTRPAATEAPLSMQSWLFLYWHQILCAELIRGLVGRCEERVKANPANASFTLEELLEELLRGGTASLGWSAAGTAARVYAAGLRFTVPVAGGSHENGGMYELAGLCMRSPQHSAGDSIFLGLKTLVSPQPWFGIHADDAAAFGSGAQEAIALEVSEALVPSLFPHIPLLGDIHDKGYEMAPRQYSVSQSLSLGPSMQVGLFPSMLVARLKASGPGIMSWSRTSASTAQDPGSKLRFIPAPTMSCAVQLQLTGKVVGVTDGKTLVSLMALAPAQRETLARLMNENIAGGMLGVRLAPAGGAIPARFEDASATFADLRTFRTNVTREENPPRPFMVASSQAAPYFGQGPHGARDVLRAWTLTAADACYLSANFGAALPRPTTGETVEVLFIFLPVLQSPDFVVQAANAVVYGGQAPEELLIGTRSQDREKVTGSHRDAIVVRGNKPAIDAAVVELPDGLRNAFAAARQLTLRELRALARTGGHALTSSAAQAHADLVLLADSVEPWASHFDLLSYSVFVDGVQVVDEDEVIPALPNNVDGEGQSVGPEHGSRFVVHIPTRRLNAGGNPYALVGRKIQVYGHFRDHFGQRAPQQPTLLLERIEEYRDEILSVDAWDHMDIRLEMRGTVACAVVSANLQTCRADRARSDLLYRRFALLKGQLEDANLRMEVQWTFGSSSPVALSAAGMCGLVDSLVAALYAVPGTPATEFVLPLAWPTLPTSWCALPFGAEVRIVRKVRNSDIEWSTIQLSPLGDDGAVVPVAFFAPMLRHFQGALLGVGDPGRGFGRFWLVNKGAVNLQVNPASANFFAMPPFANRLVSTGGMVDRDLDLALRESFGKLDTVLQDETVARLGDGQAALLNLKKTASLTCARRTSAIGRAATGAADAAQRAIENAVAAKAADAYSIASVLNFRMGVPDADAVANVMKLTGDLAPTHGAAAGRDPGGLGVTTIGVVRTGDELQLPVVVWTRPADAGSVRVPALSFKPRQLQIDVKLYNMLAGGAAATEADRFPYMPPVGHWLNLVEVEGRGPDTLSLTDFAAPNPRREAVATPLADVHMADRSVPIPASLAQAKTWTYSARFKLPPAAAFDPRVDFLYCDIEYPWYDGLHHTGDADPVGALLSAAVTFNEVAASVLTPPDAPAAILDMHELAAAAQRLEAALQGYPNSFMLGQADHTDRISMVPSGGQWAQKSDAQNQCAAITGLVEPDRRAFVVKAERLDVCALPSAWAFLQVNRNEKLTFGYGSSTEQDLAEAFIYRTPRVGFSDAVLANLSHAPALPAGQPGLDVAAWVESVYSELLTPFSLVPLPMPQNALSVQCRVGWNVANVSRIAGDAVEPAAVALVSVTSHDYAHVAGSVREAVDAWVQEIGAMPQPANGHWSLDLAIFLNVRGAAGVQSRRVANFRRLKPA